MQQTNSSLKLAHKVIKSGKPSRNWIFLHGIYNSKQNFDPLIASSKILSQGNIHLLDQRNHGDSPHSSNCSVNSSAQDVVKYIESTGINKFNILGHSMGGLVAIEVALCRPDLIESIFVIDIVPRKTYFLNESKDLIKYKKEAKQIDQISLEELNAEKVEQRLLEICDGDQQSCRAYIDNLITGEDGNLRWKFNSKILSQNFQEIVNYMPKDSLRFEGKLFLLGGDQSDLLADYDFTELKKWFPNFDPEHDKEMILDAGHSVHLEKVHRFCELFETHNKELST